MSRNILILVTSLALASSLQAQPQKQINLGGGFVLNTKIQQDVSTEFLNDLFPLKGVSSPAFVLPVRPNVEEETAAVPDNKVRTICGEWVEKSDRLVSVYKGRDWYIEKSSACAQEYYNNWKEQQDLSFIRTHQERAKCEQDMHKHPSQVEMHTCAICGQAIDGRCGAVASVYNQDGTKQYAHADCKAKARFEQQAAQLRHLLGVEEAPALAKPAPVTQTAAYLSKQAKNNALSELKNISVPAVRPQRPAQVTKEEMDDFISQNGVILNTAAHKKRSGQTLNAQEQAVLAHFENLRQGYAAWQNTLTQPAARGNNYVPAPSRRANKTFEPDKKPLATSAQPVNPASQAIKAKTDGKFQPDVLPSASTPNTALEKAPQAPAFSAPQNTLPRTAPGKTYKIISKKDLKDFERANKKDMPIIRALATSGASSSDSMLTEKARVYKIFTESYQYLNTPQGKAALARVQAFEKEHKTQINIIRQWATYAYPQDTPHDLRPLVKEYKQILKEGNLKL